MSKKGRNKNNFGRKWKKFTQPDEAIIAGPLSIARFGKYIQFSNSSTSEEHAEFLKQSHQANSRIITELSLKVQKLQINIQQYDPLVLMHRATYMLLPLLTKYRSENEFTSQESYYLPAVEYLQYLIARTTKTLTPKALDEKNWEEIWEKTISILELTGAYILTRKTLSNPPTELDELRFTLDYMRLLIRIKRYPYFLPQYLKIAIEPYQKWIDNVYNCTAEDIIKGVKEIAQYLKCGVTQRYHDSIESTHDLMDKLRAKGFVVDPGASVDEIEETKLAMLTSEFEKLFTDVDEKLKLTFTPAIFDISEVSNLPKNILSLLSVKPGESILTTLTGLNHDDLSPLSTSVLHYKPFLEIDNHFYSFYHSGLEDRIGDIIEADLFEKKPEQVSEMAKKRSDYMEDISRKIFVELLKPDSHFQNIYYINPDEQGGLTELDILLATDDILFLIEVKSGGFSEAATRGAPKDVEKELSDLIIKGQQQSERAERYIKSAETVDFYDSSGKKSVCKISYKNYRQIFRIIVTKEDLGWVGAKIAVLSILDPNLSKSYPWHISIDDLMIVAELFKDDELRFVHYLEQRLKAASLDVLNQHDEIEHIGLYNHMNHYHDLQIKGMDRMTFDASYMQNIDHYFSDQSAGRYSEKPKQKIPTKMNELLTALKDSCLAGRFELASLILSLDGEWREKFENGLILLEEGKNNGKQKSFRVPFNQESIGFSITYFNETNWREELLRSTAQMIQSECTTWLVAQINEIPKLNISKVEKLTLNRFSDIEIEPYLKKIERRIENIGKIGRNEKCPCGTGKKYKYCHGS